MWNPFKRKKIEEKLSISELFPRLSRKIRRTVKLNFGLDWAIFLTIYGALSSIGVYGATGVAIANILTYTVIIGASMGLSMAVSSLTTKSGKQGNLSTGGLMMNTRMVTDPIKVIYGKRRVGASQVFIHTTGATGLNMQLHMICVWCEGPVQGIATDGAGEMIYIGERRIQDFQTYMNRSYVTHTFYNGSADQIVNASLASAFPAFADAMRYTAFSYFVFNFNQSLYTGFPQVTAVIEGMKLFDPRDGSISYSTNPALAWRDFKTNPRYGGGIAGSLIDVQSVSDAATWCSNNGYTFNGVIADRQSFLDNLEDMLMGFRGEEIWSGGQYKLLIQTYSTPVMALDERDIKIDDANKNAIGIQTAGIQDSPTRVRVTFGDRANNYIPNFACWPQVSIIVSEGIELDRETKEVELMGIVDYTMALKIAKYLFLKARWSRSFSAFVHPRLLAMELGDMVQASHNPAIPLGSIPEDWSNKVLRVASASIGQDNSIIMVFTEESSDIYDDAVQETTPHYPYNTTTPSIFDTPPDPDNLTFDTGADEETANIIDSYIDFIWDNMGDGLDYKLRYRYSDVSRWTSHSVPVPVGVIGIPSKVGTGTLTIMTSGEYSGATEKNYKVEIDGVGSPNTLRWSDDGGSTWDVEDVPIVTGWMNLNNGINIKSSALTGGVMGDYWTFTAIPMTPVIERIGKFKIGQTVYWQVQAITPNNIKSEWITPTFPAITWDPNAPTMVDVVLDSASEGNAVVLSWTKAASDYGLLEWVVKRNSVNNPATAITLDYKSIQSRSYRDMAVVTGETYYYWLKCIDKFNRLSSDFSNVSAITFMHGVRSPIYDTVGSGDVPGAEGSTAFIADTITLDDCDDYTDFQDDATDADDIIIEQDIADLKEGTGSLKITAGPYFKKLSFESSYGTPYNLGRIALNWGYRYASQGFKPATNITCKAIGLKIIKVGTPANLLVDIYSDSGGVPNVSLGSATLLVANVPTVLGSDPFVYAVFASTISLTSGTLYHIVLDSQGYSLTDYYKVYGYFQTYGDVDQFGGAGEMYHVSANKTAWTNVIFDNHDCWDMNFRVCVTSTALNKYVWSTIASKDIQLKTYLKFWTKATRTGTNFQIGFGEAAVSDNLFNVAISAVDTWEFKVVDISGVPAANRDAIIKVGIKITNLDSLNVIHLDGIFANIDYPSPKIFIGGAWRSYILDNDPHFISKRTIAYKSADESVISSAVLQDDDHLKLAVGISEKWGVKFTLMGNNGAVGLFKMKFTVPTNGKFYWWYNFSGVYVPTETETVTMGSLDFGTTRGVFEVRGIYVGGDTAGTLQLQWAQQTSNGTATKLLIGSYMEADKLAPL